MAEAVAALSLAANILQVLDFGKRFTFAAWTIYRSGVEGVDFLSGLQASLDDFWVVLRELREDAARASSSNSNSGDDGM
jgi:hypothetical protein